MQGHGAKPVTAAERAERTEAPDSRSGAVGGSLRWCDGRSRQCPVRERWRGAGELVGLVDDVGGDLLELVAVLTGVVGAEQQLTTRLELDAEVGLGSATVAAVRCAQRRGAGGNCSGHIGLISFCLDVSLNVAAGSKIPRTVECFVCLTRPSNHGCLFPHRQVSMPRAAAGGKGTAMTVAECDASSLLRVAVRSTRGTIVSTS